MKNVLLFLVAMAVVLACTLEKTMPLDTTNGSASYTSTLNNPDPFWSSGNRIEILP